ncbi:MAG: hypothetical protein Ct9H300mP31_08700 [Acidimicrobiaceae bacterium]|nr:MAG: hypothetical protein Ct9H300mP31_08700 [Acidimicrobiaceae bacterium]
MVLVVLLMAASGVLVAAETSLLHIRRAQAEVPADSGTEADDSGIGRICWTCWTTECVA